MCANSDRNVGFILLVLGTLFLIIVTVLNGQAQKRIVDLPKSEPTINCKCGVNCPCGDDD